MSGPHSKETVSEHHIVGIDNRQLWRQLFSTAGDGSGTTDMSTGADEYFIFPSAGDVYVVEKIKIVVEDNGDFPNDEFAATGGALVNGIDIKFIKGDTTSYAEFVDLLGGLTLKQNSDFISLGETIYSVDITNLSVIVCNIDLTKELGYPIKLDGDYNDGLKIETQDDMSSLIRMYAIASGIQQENYR